MFSYFSFLRNFSNNAKLFLLGNFLFSFGISFFGLLFNLYLKKKGLPESQVGNILSFLALGATFMALIAISFLEVVKTKWLMMVSVLVISISQIAQVYFNDLNIVKLGAFLTGMFTALLTVTVGPFFMRNSNEPERVHLFSFHFASIIFAQFLGFYVAGHLPAMLINRFGELPYDGYFHSVIIGSVFSLSALLLFLKIEKKPIPKANIPLKYRLKEANWSKILKLMWPKLTLGMGAGMVIPFLNLYLKQVFHLSTEKIGIFFSIQQIFVFVGMLSMPFMANALGRLASIVVTTALSIPFMLIMALTENWKYCIIAFCFRGMLMNMAAPVTSIFEMNCVEEQDHSIITALSFFSWNLGWSFSSKLSGHIIEQYSFRHSFYLAILLYFISITSYLLLFWPNTKRCFKVQESIF